MGFPPNPGGATAPDLRILSVVDYGADPTGVADATTPIQNAINAWIAAGNGILLFPRGDYLISGTLTAKPPTYQKTPMLVSGYGANLHLTTASSMVLFQITSGYGWKNLRIEGLRALIDSNAVTDAFKFWDGGGSTSGSFYNWVARDLVVETGTATVPINNGIVVANDSSNNTVFQFAIEDCNMNQPFSVAGVGILVGGSGAAMSSILISNPNTYGYLNGITIGSNSLPAVGSTIVGGSIVGAYKEGVKLYIQGGGLYNTHVEGSWGVAPSGATEGGDIYLQGHGSIVEPDLHTNGVNGVGRGLGFYGIAVWSTGAATNLIGQRLQTLRTITATANNGSGLIRVTAAGHSFVTGGIVAITGVLGTTEANGTWTITVIDANTFDLQGSTYVNAYVSGGQARTALAKILSPGGNTTGTVNVIGVQPIYVDTSAVVTANSPSVNQWPPPSRRARTLAGQGILNENIWPAAAPNLSAPISQTVYGASMGLNVGDRVTGIILRAGTAAVGAGLPTTVRAGIADSTGKILALSGNLNAAANVPQGAVKLPLTAPYTIQADGIYFACFVVDGTWTTPPTLYRGTGATTGTSALSGMVPPGFSWTGQTDLPAVGASLTTSVGMSLSYYMGFY